MGSWALILNFQQAAHTHLCTKRGLPLSRHRTLYSSAKKRILCIPPSPRWYYRICKEKTSHRSLMIGMDIRFWLLAHRPAWSSRSSSLYCSQRSWGILTPQGSPGIDWPCTSCSRSCTRTVRISHRIALPGTVPTWGRNRRPSCWSCISRFVSACHSLIYCESRDNTICS